MYRPVTIFVLDGVSRVTRIMGAVISNAPALKLKLILKALFYVSVVVMSQKCVYLLMYELANTKKCQ
jgi:hypothetical protein